MNSRKTNRIGIAVVEYRRQFLIGIRPAGTPLAGYHEFPGGKCQVDETPADCVVRECREETGLEVAPQQELLYQEHSYEHADVQLHFWICQPKTTTPDPLAADLQGFHWFPAESLVEMQFPEANAGLVELLVSTYAAES